MTDEQLNEMRRLAKLSGCRLDERSAWPTIIHGVNAKQVRNVQDVVEFIQQVRREDK